MKVLSIILSLYVLVLTTIPCVDRPFAKITPQSEYCGTASDHLGHDDDSCSPFCVCNCCGNHVVSIEKLGLSKIFSYPGEKITPTTISFKSNLFRSIWQPPKIS